MITLTRGSVVVVGVVAAAAALLSGTGFASTPSDSGQTGAVELLDIEGDGYTILVADPSASVGEVAHIKVTIKAKSGYKVNKLYPTKIKLADPPDGIELPKRVLKKKDGTSKDDKTFYFMVPVKATRAGTFEVAGRLKFSVCSDSTCLIKKKDMRSTVSAK